MVFGQKLEILSFLGFLKTRPKESVLTLWRENWAFETKKQNLKKSKFWHFSKVGSPQFLVKFGKFVLFCFMTR